MNVMDSYSQHEEKDDPFTAELVFDTQICYREFLEQNQILSGKQNET